MLCILAYHSSTNKKKQHSLCVCVSGLFFVSWCFMFCSSHVFESRALPSFRKCVVCFLFCAAYLCLCWIHGEIEFCLKNWAHLRWFCLSYIANTHTHTNELHTVYLIRQRYSNHLPTFFSRCQHNKYEKTTTATYIIQLNWLNPSSNHTLLWNTFRTP